MATLDVMWQALPSLKVEDHFQATQPLVQRCLDLARVDLRFAPPRQRDGRKHGIHLAGSVPYPLNRLAQGGCAAAVENDPLQERHCFRRPGFVEHALPGAVGEPSSTSETVRLIGGDQV